MPYSKQTWNNGPTGNTPINAARLQHIEDGIETLDLELQFGGGSTSPKVVVFDGTSKSSYHGDYWPVGTNLGQFLWEFICRLDGNDVGQGYLISEGLGGAHAILYGLTPSPSGNIYTGSTITVINAGSYTPEYGEWIDTAVGWDSTVLWTWVNGILTSLTPFAGPRQAQAGQGMLFIAGSDHSNFQGALASVRAFEYPAGGASMPNISPGVVGCAYSPDVVKGPIVGDKSQGTPRATTSFDYQKGGLVVVDAGTGYNGSTHSGQLVGHLTPAPVYEVDSTYPFNNFPVTRTRTPPTPSAVPSGAAVFDSFGRQDSIPMFADYEYPYVKTLLGTTEGGSLGPLAWQNDYQSRPQTMWGVFNHAAVFTGTGTGPAWVNMPTPNNYVKVKRDNINGFNPTQANDPKVVCAAQTGDISICIRVYDASNYLYLQIYHDSFTSNFVRLFSHVAGADTILATWTLPNYSWSVLGLDATGTTITCDVDGTTIGTVTGVTTLQSSKGVGLFQQAQVTGTCLRYKDFTVYQTSFSPAAAPSAPTGLTATPFSQTRIDLSWSAVTGATMYLIYRASVAGGPYTLIATQAGTTYSSTGLTAATTYYYVVRAENTGGMSGNSTEASATTTAVLREPDAPTIGTATAGNTQATVTWTAPGFDGGSAITGYEVKTYNSTGTLLATNTVGVVLTYTKTGLTNGVAVKFKVAAINAQGTGAQSAFSNTATPIAPGAADTFNRANGSLGTSSSGHVWTESYTLGQLLVISNKAGESTYTAGNAYLETGLTDGTFSVDIGVSASVATEHQLNFRQIDNGTFISFQLYRYDAAGGGTTAVIIPKVSGTWGSAMASAFPTIASGSHTMSVVVSGDSITCKVDGTTLLSHTLDSGEHTTFSAGTKAGIGTGRASDLGDGTFDNFSAT